jgi:hypothetical protein
MLADGGMLKDATLRSMTTPYVAGGFGDTDLYIRYQTKYNNNSRISYNFCLGFGLALL